MDMVSWAILQFNVRKYQQRFDALADQHVIHVACGGSLLAAITGKLRHDLELHLWYTFFLSFFLFLM